MGDATATIARLLSARRPTMFKILEEKLNHELSLNDFDVYDTGYEQIIFYNNRTFVEYKPEKMVIRKNLVHVNEEVPF